MARRTKSVHNIVINECSIYTQLEYNTDTDHIYIGTFRSYRKNYNKDTTKAYRENHKDEISNYNKTYRENHKDEIKAYRELHRDPNMLRRGSKELAIKISCDHQGIGIEDFDGFTHEHRYCSKFNNSLKQSIRNRYNNCDYISGIHKDVCNPDRELSVHHVNYDKDCGCNEVKCELIPLSQSNHAKTNINRYFWNCLFIYSLQYDETYNQTIIIDILTN